MRSSDGARYLGYSGHPFATDVDERTALCFVCHPRLVWNHGFTTSSRMITKDKSTRFRAMVILPYICKSVGARPGEGSVWDILNSSYLRYETFESISRGVQEDWLTRSLRHPVPTMLRCLEVYLSGFGENETYLYPFPSMFCEKSQCC